MVCDRYKIVSCFERITLEIDSSKVNLCTNHLTTAMDNQLD